MWVPALTRGRARGLQEHGRRRELDRHERGPSKDPEDTDVSALAIDPQTPATVYAGTYYHGVFKSTDGGRSWQAVNAGLPRGQVFVHALAIDPRRTATVYAATDRGFPRVRTEAVHGARSAEVSPSTSPPSPSPRPGASSTPAREAAASSTTGSPTDAHAGRSPALRDTACRQRLWLFAHPRDAPGDEYAERVGWLKRHCRVVREGDLKVQQGGNETGRDVPRRRSGRGHRSAD